jgi:hypothetical protein
MEDSYIVLTDGRMCSTEGEESRNAMAADRYREAVYNIVRIKFMN